MPFCLIAQTAVLGACSMGPNEPQVAMRVEWQTGVDDVPDDVTCFALFMEVDGEVRGPTNVTVANLPRDERGRRFIASPFYRGIPTGTRVRFAIRGLGPTADQGNPCGPARRFGSVGPIVFRPGERRFVELRMYNLGVVSEPVNFAEFGGRFLHTSTTLPDGRVLIAGGFSSLAPSPCPPAVPADAICRQAVATNSVILFVPASGRFYEVAGGMLEARAGHTATALPDGRVLIAGGAAEATFAVARSGATFEPFIVPRGMASTTAELFLPETPSEREDLDMDGDPGRGSLVPIAGNRDLNEGRFLHAAAGLRGNLTGDPRVIVAGGIASSDDATDIVSSTTYEVFDELDGGEIGFYPPSPLASPRAWPGALSLGDRVWIVGGTLTPSTNDDLGEIWTPAESGVGTVGPAAASSAFPNPTGDTTGRPGFALRRPAATVVGGDSPFGVVAGWLGPLCEPGTSNETFFSPASATELCGTGPAGGRSFVIDGQTGSTTPLPLTLEHAFGTATTLSLRGAGTDTAVAVTGGLSSNAWEPTAEIELFDFVAGSLVPAAPASLRAARAFHTASPLQDGGLLIVGGLTFNALPLDQPLTEAAFAPTPNPTAEVLYRELPP